MGILVKLQGYIYNTSIKKMQFYQENILNILKLQQQQKKLF